MLKKIDIQSFGLFQDYNWTCKIGDDKNATFKDINIIYGRNYSGKTTLSRIFKWIEDGKINDNYKNCKFTITDNENNTITETNLSYKNIFRVYNSDFVKNI